MSADASSLRGSPAFHAVRQAILGAFSVSRLRLVGLVRVAIPGALVVKSAPHMRLS